MRRVRLIGLSAGLVVAAVAAPGDATVRGGTPFHAARAFVGSAEAYPMQAAPGTQETEVSARPAATKAVASNPPADAFARAAAADLGLAEAYFGQQGPSANADTATAGQDHDVVVDESGSHLEAHADPAPVARASATGSATGPEPRTSGSVASASAADGSGERLVATVEAEVHDLALGALFIGSGRFDARVEVDGRPGGARGEGVVRTSDATFAGVPVTIGSDGIHVDEARVPAALVPTATAQVQEAFNRGGYADIRVVQPAVEVAEDGTSARVSGGGVHVFLTNNDPNERYFTGYTLLGGTARALLGGEVAIPTPDRDPGTVIGPPAATPSRPVGGRPPSPSAPVVGGEPGAASVAAGELAYEEGAARVSLPVPWPGWVWLVVVLAALWIAAGALRVGPLRPARERLDAARDGFADRYLRG